MLRSARDHERRWYRPQGESRPAALLFPREAGANLYGSSWGFSVVLRAGAEARLEPEELDRWFEEGRGFVMLDTRNEYEVRMGKFVGAVHSVVVAGRVARRIPPMMVRCSL